MSLDSILLSDPRLTIPAEAGEGSIPGTMPSGTLTFDLTEGDLSSKTVKHGLLAQLVARSLDMGEVTSSSLVQTTNLLPRLRVCFLQRSSDPSHCESGIYDDTINFIIACSPLTFFRGPGGNIPNA